MFHSTASNTVALQPTYIMSFQVADEQDSPYELLVVYMNTHAPIIDSRFVNPQSSEP